MQKVLMFIIRKEEIKDYKDAVAKTIFLKTFEDLYELIEDVQHSNLIKVRDKKTNLITYIAILKEPEKHPDEKYLLKIYYQYYKRKNESKHKNSEIYAFSNKEERGKKFNEDFKKAIKDAFINPKLYLNNVPQKYIKLVDYFYSTIKKQKDAIPNLYKYRETDNVVNNCYNVLDGEIAFTHPEVFNDPFDCNYYLKNNKNMSNRFRVLCLTIKYNDILMWSYYASEHKGYCLEYDSKNIVKEIEELSIAGLCVYGEVEYKSERPKLKSSSNRFSYTNIEYYVNAVFAKFVEWEHEKEIRFVIISDEWPKDLKEPDEDAKFITITPGIEKIYEGCQGQHLEIKDSNNKIKKAIQLKKDKVKYDLSK